MKEIINKLEEKILEAGRTEECMRRSLNEKHETCEKIEAYLALLLEKTDTQPVQDQYENSSKLLDKIISAQRDPSNKSGIGCSS